MKRTEIKSIIADPKIGGQVLIKGWVRAFRANRFIQLNDGSCFDTIQCVVDFEQFDAALLKKISFHSCIAVTGQLVESQGKGQSVEVIVDKLELLGGNNPDEYPLQPKRMTMEYLREKAHFRMRTNVGSAVFRIRHAVAFAVHQYFHKEGYYWMHTPIITGSDAEGAGEMFRVTTLDAANPPKTEDGAIDFGKDFFGKATNLTVSGQLQGEIAALSLGKIYTFGPTFRAENSHTTRHLSEFWMIEPEVAFYDIHDNMDLAEDFVKYLINFILDNYAEDLAFLDQRIKDEEKSLPTDKRRPMGLIEQLKFVVDNDFERITYTEAIRLLKNSKPYKKGQFKFPVEWGTDLQSEHERFLVEKMFKKPVVVRDYPKSFKAFYMRENDPSEDVPGATVAAMDILFPYIGEVIGGSQREERLEKLQERVAELGEHAAEELYWYLDLRKFGGCPHAGFGMGFERMVQFITGMTNIRDVIAFPRYPGNAEY